MSIINVDMAEMAISDDPEEILEARSLGSCLGIAVYDPEIRAGGMIHCMLPLSSVDPRKAAAKPCMFVDTGFEALLEKLSSIGVQKERALIKAAGGAHVLDGQGLFRIGERNFVVLRKLLWKHGLLISSEHVGGEISRTMRLEIKTGRCSVAFEGLEIGI
jgi:chemotaxis protein CheD